MFSLNALLVQIIRSICNAFFDIQYGGFLFDVANSDYSALSSIFENRIKPQDVLVDIGCGKGRVINWWLSRRLENRIIGLEMDEDTSNKTRRRLRKYKNVTIIHGNAIENIPADGTLFYMFNPFGRQDVEALKIRLASLFGQRGGITLLYYNCVYVGVFQQDPAWNVEHFDVGRPSPIPFSRCAIIQIRSNVDAN
jgi:hypothetical protein